MMSSDRLQDWIDVLPDEVDFALHVADVGCGDYHGVLVRNHDDVLAVRSVCAEGVVGAAPHLVAVALEPVACLCNLLHQVCMLGGQTSRYAWNLCC